MSVYSTSGASQQAFKRRLKTVQAVSEITTSTSSLKQVRENVNSYHSRWFEAVSKMCNEVGTTPSMPRMVVNVIEQVYQHLILLNITVPIWDHLLSELDKRFSSHQKNCFSRSILGTISVGNRRSCNYAVW